MVRPHHKKSHRPSSPRKHRHVLQVAYLKDALAGEFDLRAVTLLPRDWTSLLKTSREKFIVPDRDLDAAALEAMEREESAHGGAAVVTGAPPRVVAIRVAALDAATGRLPDFQARALAVHFMASRVVVPFVDCGADEQERAHAAVEDLLCGTWAAHSSLEGVAKARATPFHAFLLGCGRSAVPWRDLRRGTRRPRVQFCLGGGRSPSGASLREVLRLRQAVRDEVFAKIEKWGRVNYVWCAAFSMASSTAIPYAGSASDRSRCEDLLQRGAVDVTPCASLGSCVQPASH